MAILETRALRKVYGSGDTQVRALDGVDLAVEPGESTAIVGTSGSGKSTLLHTLGGLDRPTGGTVTVDGRRLLTSTKRIGVVGVDYGPHREHTRRLGVVIGTVSRPLCQ